MTNGQNRSINPRVLQSIARKLLREHRAEKIEKIVGNRGIEILCHFTRVENLSSILKWGLLGRSRLVEQRIPFERIDHSRQDGCPEAVCLTISFPNYRLFYSKRGIFYGSHGIDDNQWVVLLFEAKLLWELDCAFCKYNAAHGSVRGLSLDSRREPESLASMFGDFPTHERPRNFPSHYPTSPQAEVLVFDPVPISYLREIHFFDDDAYEEWSSSDYSDNDVDIYVGNYYFDKRRIK
ncbi:MAG: DarT ssDNA thymidine ADP-ribosyltransferase family protein [Caldilineaceae bacterium]|nr:DarT ssDNA thymidine ADP-ribosyltransferase family protein [Caldilineaceae bacterium]